MVIKKIYFLLLPALFFCACFTKKEIKNNDAIKAEMVAAEISFSKLSQEKGSRVALMQFIDSNGILLRPNSYPLVGGNAIDFISQANDSFYSMNWQPKGAGIAESGELGYTYGVYTVSVKDKDTLIHGTYVNIWKKQPDGTWKLVLDSGNEGLEEEE